MPPKSKPAANPKVAAMTERLKARAETPSRKPMQNKPGPFPVDKTLLVSDKSLMDEKMAIADEFGRSMAAPVGSDPWELTAEEKAAANALPPDFIKRLIAGDKLEFDARGFPVRWVKQKRSGADRACCPTRRGKDVPHTADCVSYFPDGTLRLVVATVIGPNLSSGKVHESDA